MAVRIERKTIVLTDATAKNFNENARHPSLSAEEKRNRFLCEEKSQRSNINAVDVVDVSKASSKVVKPTVVKVGAIAAGQTITKTVSKSTVRKAAAKAKTSEITHNKTRKAES